MSLPNLNRITWIALAACAALSLPAIASAQVEVKDLVEVEIDRDADALRDEIRPRIKDVDLADTALVFTNTAGRPARVGCVAYHQTGMPIGRARLWVPGNGVKFMRASDLSNGRDFVGQVVCTTLGLFLPSAIFLGPVVENMNVRVTDHDMATRIRFPLVATY